MARRQNTKVGGLLRLPPPPSLTVLIAIKGNSESKDVGIVNWALDKLVAEGMFLFKLIHVRPTITTVRTAELTDSSSIASYASFPFPFNGLSTINQTILYKKANSSGTLDSRFTSLEFDLDDSMSSCPGSSDIGRPSSSLPSCQILETDAFSRVSRQATFGDATTLDDRPEFSFENQMDVDLEIERLISELRPPRKLYPMTQNDAIDGSEEVNYLNNLLLEESIKLGEINYEEEEAKELAIQEEVKYETARQEAENVKECVEREAAERNEDGNKALKKAKKKEKLENAQGGPIHATLCVSRNELTDSSSIASYASFPFPFNSLSTINQTILYKKANSSGTLDSRFTSLEFDRDDCMSSCPGSSDIGRPSSSLPSCQILETDAFSRVPHQATFGDAALDAISKEVDKSTVDKLVIGASSHGGICSRCRNEFTDIAESMPKFCTVYTVSKGKLSSFRPPDLDTHRIITIPSPMIHSSSNESSFDNSNSQAGAAVDDHVGLHSVIQAPNCRQNQAVLNRGSQMQRHNQIKSIIE